MANSQASSRQRARRPQFGWESFEARTLLAGDPLFFLSIADAPPVDRPPTGFVFATFPVVLDPANIEETVTVHYQTADGTAIAADGDYVPASGDLSFLPGETFKTISVMVSASDVGKPPSQSFFVNLSDPAPASTVGILDATAVGVINNPDPLVVVNTTDAGIGSLRVAITYANTLPVPSPTEPVISFAIPGTGPFTIAPPTLLPEITRSVTIDATTQPGFAGLPVVELTGAGLSDGLPEDASGLVVFAGGTTIRGLSINRFPGSGIVLSGLGRNLVVGNFLGTDPAGGASLGNGQNGLLINDSSDNTVDGNLISGNGSTGVRLEGPGSTNNRLFGNKIGTDASGTFAIPNTDDGVFLNEAPNNVIGSVIAGAGNIISGNGSTGVQILGASASGNVIIGNLIGTDMAGRSRLPNANDGVFVNNAPNNRIGAAVEGGGNIISGNGSVGVQIFGPGATGNVVQGNRIGTNRGGDAPLGNARDGAFLNQAPANFLGGPGAGEGNLISGNGSVGIQVLGPSAIGNVIQGNRIGTDAAGLVALPNVRDGVFVNNAPQTLVGGAGAGQGNLVSANGSVGVQIFGPGSAGGRLVGNQVGVDSQLRPRLPNLYGVFLNGATGFNAGPNSTQASNLVRGNRVAQVYQVVGPPMTSTATREPRAARAHAHPRFLHRRFVG